MKVNNDKLYDTLQTVKNIRLPNTRGIPLNNSPGSIIFDQNSNKFYGKTNTGWVPLIGGSGGSFERISPPNQTINPNINKTIVDESPPINPTWAANLYNSFVTFGYGVATDSNDNVYITGSYISDISAYNKTNSMVRGVPKITIPYQANSGDANSYVIKYNSTGEPLWGVPLIETINYNSCGSVRADSLGNVYICGVYSNTCSLVDSQGNFYFTLPKYYIAGGDTGIFLIKYNSTGIPQWGSIIDSPEENSVGFQNLAIDANDNILLVGSYQSSICNFYGPTTVTMNSSLQVTVPFSAISGFPRNAFIAKYTPEGNVDFVSTSRGLGYNVLDSIALDSQGNIYSTGNYNSTCGMYYPTTNLIQGTLGFSLGYSLPVGITHTYVLKNNSQGAPMWATNIFSDSGNNMGIRVAVDNQDNLYISGVYESTIIIYTETTSTMVGIPHSTVPFLGSLGSANAFLIKYNSTGTPLWSTVLSANSYVPADGLGVDTFGNVYFSTGYTVNCVIYAAGSTIPTFTLPPGNNNSIGLIKYNYLGTPQWATFILNNSYNYGGLALDTHNNIYLAGFCTSDVVELYGQISNNITATIPQFTVDGSPNAVYSGLLIKYENSNAFDNVLALDNPTQDGFTKCIGSNYPQIFIKPQATVNDTTSTIVLDLQDSVVMLWDALDNNWIIKSLTGTIN